MPIEERHGIVWVWLGDPAKVDATRVPALAFFDDLKRARSGRMSTEPLIQI